MVLELDEDEAAVQAAIVRARIQVDVRDAVQDLGQLLQKLQFGFGFGHPAEEQPAVVHGLDHADAMTRSDLIAVEASARFPGDPRLREQRERVAARRPWKVQHQAELQQSANLFQHRHQLVFIAVARQPAQKYLRALAALPFATRHFRCGQPPLTVLL